MLKNNSTIAKIFVMKKSDFIILMLFYLLFISFLYFVGRTKTLEEDTRILNNRVDSLNSELITNQLQNYYIFEHSELK